LIRFAYAGLAPQKRIKSLLAIQIGFAYDLSATHFDLHLMLMIKITHHGPITRFELARTLAGRRRYWSVAYLVDGMLVDSGPAHTAWELQQALGEKPLLRIFNTHTHEDHIGGNEPLKRYRPSLEILAHPLGLPVLANPRVHQPLHLYRRLFWGWPGASQAQGIDEGALLETENYSFEVIYTPGHTRDHLCLYEPRQGWLFTGDLYVGGRDRAIRAGSEIWEIINSLKRLAILPASRLFPGCARVRENPKEVLSGKVTYLEELGARMLKLYERGMDIPAIAREVCGLPMPVEVITLGHFSRRHLVHSYINGKY
jgi:glyoxylase-like metal-dependent hydrolase (beta-lactamase superfamily II)